MGVFLAQGNAVIEQFEAGDVGYAPMGAGHYIKNTGAEVCRILIGFNNPHYRAMDLSEWLAGNPADVLATTFGLSPEVAAKLPHKTVFVAPPVSRK
ncbi:MAG: cupin domain-containing protein, partial [Candidatus Korobacteraceae bacterium]